MSLTRAPPLLRAPRSGAPRNVEALAASRGALEPSAYKDMEVEGAAEGEGDNIDYPSKDEGKKDNHRDGCYDVCSANLSSMRQ